MNISTTPRRVAQGLLVLCFTLATMVGAKAQCDMIYAGSQPLELTAELSNTLGGGGTVTIDESVIGAYIGSSTCGLTPGVAGNVWFYTGLSQASSVGSSLVFTCADIINANLFYYVRIVPTGDPATSANASTAIQIHVTVKDVHPPVIPAIANVAIGTDPTICGWVSTAAVNALQDDNCGVTALSWTATGVTIASSPLTGINQAAGTTFNKGLSTLTYTAKDASGNTTTRSFTITVSDDDPPTVTCPGLQLRNTDPNLCTALVNGIQPAVTENCTPTVTWAAPGAIPASGLTNASGTVFPLGNTVVTYTVTDGVNPAVMCNFTVTVSDMQAPTIICPSVAVLSKNTDPGVCNYTAVGTEFNATGMTDNCGITLSGTNPSNTKNPFNTLAGEVFNLGMTSVTWTVTDQNGKTASCAFTVKVSDNQSPSLVPLDTSLISYANAFVVNNAPGTCSQTVEWYRPSVTGFPLPPSPYDFTLSLTDNCPTTFTVMELQPTMPNGMVFPLGIPGYIGSGDFFVDNGVTPYPYDNGNPLHRTSTVDASFPIGTTTLRYKVTDSNGQATTLMITVQVNETEKPIAKCIAANSLTLAINPLGGALVAASLVNNGSSDNCGIQSLIVSPNVFDCTQLGSQMVTLTVTDFATNTASCTTTLFIVDNIPPTVICPISQVVSTATGTCAANVPGLMVVSNDNCDPPVLTYDYKVDAGLFIAFNGTAPILPTLNLSKGLRTITVRVTDGAPAFNTGTCSFTIDVKDQEDPLLPVTTTPANPGLCAGGVITRNINTVSCNYITPPGSPLWTVGAVTDPGSCSPPVTLTSTGGSATGTYPQGDSPIMITAVDASGNITSCNFTVRISENTPPTAICKDTTVNLGNAPITLFAPTFNSNSTDNCTLGSSLTFNLLDTVTNAVIPSVTVTSNSCTNFRVKLRVRDFNGNTATCLAYVKINDNVAPVCQAQNVPSLLLNAAGTATLTVAAVNAGSSDNCALALVTPFALSKSPANFAANAQSLSFNCSERGVNTVHFRVTDKSGNTSSCAATVTVIDNIPPTVASNPGPITVACSVVTPTPAAYAQNLTPIATFSDNCTVTGVVLSVVITAGACPNAYTITRTWVATDVAGLTVQAQQVITIQDILPPVITLANPANITLSLSNYAVCRPVENYSVTVNDACGTSTTTWKIDYDNNGSVDVSGNGTTTVNTLGFVTGANLVTFTSTDQCSNPSSKTILVTVDDDEAPSFTDYGQPPFPSVTPYCGATLPQVNITSGCTYSFSWYRPYADDPIFFPLTILPDITDCNNIVDVTENIVSDVPVGPDQLQTPSIPFNELDPLNALFPTTISLPVGKTTFTYVANDNQGETSTCSFSIEVKDALAPTISCPAGGIMINTICPQQVVQDFRNTVMVNDNCSQNLSITQQYLPNPLVPSVTLATVLGGAGNVVDGATFSITFTVSDNSGNTAACITLVTLDDNQSPLPNVNPLAGLVWDCGFAYIDAPTALTNDCANGTGAVIYGTPGGVSAIPIQTLPGNPGVVIKYKVTSPPGSYFITWSYDDGNGNNSSQLQQLIINPDNDPPVARCKNTLTSITLNPGTASISPNQIDADGGSFNPLLGSYDPDRCGPFPDTNKVSLSLSQSDYTCADLGKTTVTLIVTDAFGNTATCLANIKVIDNLTPVINLATVPADTTYMVCATGFLPPPAPTVTATDNCSATVNLVQISTQGSLGASKYNYTITRTWTAKDPFGNTSTAVQVITVKDADAPVLTQPANLTFNTNVVTTDCSANVQFIVDDLVSDCAPDNELTILVNPPYFSLADSAQVLSVGNHLVTFTVTDPAGNTATTTLTFVVKDIAKPNANCINGISVALNLNGQAVITPNMINNQSSDNCGIISLEVQELELINGDTIGAPSNQLVFDCIQADNDTEYPIILLVKDAGGNFNFCETYVVIQDNAGPVLTCPANKTVNCSNNPANFNVAALGNATATDNCPQTPPMVSHTDVPVISGFECKSFVRTFKATDLAGNMGTCNQLITVQDTMAPVFTTLPPNDTIACYGPLFYAPVISATDNCTPLDSIDISLDTISTRTVSGFGKYNFKVTRTWEALDDCGNTAIHTQIIIVRDTIVPLFVGLQDTIIVKSANFAPTTNCTVPVVLNGLQFLDECAPLSECTIDSITFFPALLNPITPNILNVSGNYPVGVTRVIFNVTDPSNNHGRDTVYISVIDNSTPVVICDNNLVVVLSSNGEAEIEPSDIDLNSYDNCGIASYTLSDSLFDCTDLGFNLVTMTVTDIHNNVNSCSVVVEVKPGNNIGFTLTTTGTPASYFGGNDGTATAVVTGGSGLFEYTWSNQDSMASIDGLVAGTYIVSVVDLNNAGCLLADTIMIADGPQIGITVGTNNDCQGQTVSIPVTVNNFINVTGFSLGLDLSNAAVGAIISLSNVNPALIGLNPGATSVFWTNPTLTPTTLPNGSILFNVNIQLSAAAVGTSSSIIAAALPALVFLQDTTNQAPVVNFANGSVSISCLAANNVKIGGDVFTWKAPVKPIPGVTVNLGGTITAVDMTPALPGLPEYEFMVPAGANTLVTAFKLATMKNQQINVGDLLGIQAHAAVPQQVAFNNGYQWIAADVNGDQRITLADYAFVQKYVLGNLPHFTNNQGNQIGPNWKFIPSSHIFLPLPPNNPLAPQPNPLNTPVPPSVIARNNVAVDFVNDDFTGVLIGDVNGSATPSLTSGGGGGTESTETLKFRIDDRAVQASETVTIPFKSVDFNNTQAYQMTIAFDPEVFELQNINAGVLPGLSESNFGMDELSEGLISTLWVGGKSTSFNDNETLFSLTFKVLESVPNLSGVLYSSSDVTAAMAIDETGNTIGVDFEFLTSVATGEVERKTFALFQNQPNPFNGQTSISFRLPEAGRATLRVFSAEGRLVKTVLGNFAEGMNTITFQKSDFGSNGVFYYELETPKHSDRKKMILID